MCESTVDDEPSNAAEGTLLTRGSKGEGAHVVASTTRYYAPSRSGEDFLGAVAADLREGAKFDAQVGPSENLHASVKINPPRLTS